MRGNKVKKYRQRRQLQHNQYYVVKQIKKMTFLNKERFKQLKMSIANKPFLILQKKKRLICVDFRIDRKYLLIKLIKSLEKK